MFSSLASVLLLGIVAPKAISANAPTPPPGIELVSISAPNPLANKFALPKLSATGALLLDADSGEVLFEKNADTERPMASLTKIMTALIILEHHKLEDIVRIPSVAKSVPGSTLDLIPGQQFSIGTLLKALLIPSANDAAYTLALTHGKSIAGFVEQMNARAQALGLKHTHFANPAGLDNPEQFSTARDLAWLSMMALKFPAFRSIVQTRSARIGSVEGQEYDLSNTNPMLQKSEDVYGVKTGTTDNAGECLIVLFKVNSRSYLLVLLGSEDRYTDGLAVLNAVRESTH